MDFKDNESYLDNMKVTQIFAKQKNSIWDWIFNFVDEQNHHNSQLIFKGKMSSIIKTGRVALKLSALQKVHIGSSVVSVRNAWNKDFKPAPYPQTEEERAKAAKKYGIPVEKYEPYPNDGFGYGDVRHQIYLLT
jgi:hypothetical protein